MDQEDDIEFRGYYSKLKTFGGLLFGVGCGYFITFIDLATASRYRWLAHPGAAPIKWALVAGMLWLIWVYVFFLFKALTNKPFLEVKGGMLKISSLRKASCKLSEIEAFRPISDGRCHIQIRGKKYGITTMLSRDRRNFEDNIESLERFIGRS